MSDRPDASAQMPRRPRVSDGGAPVSGAVAAVWRRFLESSTDADITRIYPFIKDHERPGHEE